MSADHTAQWLARTWQPTLSVTGVDGIPPAGRAGNVLRPYTSLKLSFRLPPTADPRRALAAIRERLLSDPPHGASVQLLDATAEPGWNAPAATKWLQAALDEASDAVFGNESMAFGEGGSIPFMGMLGEMFPEAQYVITGALGPGANAHGPNEFLHLPTAVRLTECLSLLLRAHAAR